MYRKILPLLLLAMLAVVTITSAQTIQPAPDDDTTIDPNVNIIWPPPVYTLRDTLPVYGSANAAGMSNYFIEFRPLFETDPDGNVTPISDDAPWFPISLPSRQPVVEDVLGTWNTRTTADGLYELRLTVNVTGQPTQNFVVSPIRIENDPPEFVRDLVLGTTTEQTITPPVQPTAPMVMVTPTPRDVTPRVTANLNANIRSGDSTRFEIVGSLGSGQTADVVGVSATGSGWYLIRFDGNRQGWIASSVVTASGDFRNVERVMPPPPPATATPTPPPANLTGSPPALTPATPVCNEPFRVLVNITNTGSAPTAGPATVLVQDIHVASGQVQNSFTQTVPVLAPGENFVVGRDDFVISTFFNEEHEIRAIIDPNNEVPESNTADNILITRYTLDRGGC
ncbi:MAG: hypothetical protein EA396_08195 [Anaerolineaceae bacterium]|nr:MAG: hypothetical protein EA396_08195 [Anaerolineaceae bacterium]